jgi:hypothetical protein
MTFVNDKAKKDNPLRHDRGTDPDCTKSITSQYVH